MNTLTSILECHANYVSDSGYTVHVSTNMGTVAISHTDASKSIYLQGDDAIIFISESILLYEKLDDITYSSLYLALAKPYIDCID